jgi:cysteine desulfurase
MLEEALRRGPGLVSVMHANNEIGTIAPVDKLAALTHATGGLFHTDAVQSMGKIPVDVDTLGVDLLTISAHKLYGPKGIGALYVRRGTPCASILHGGGQERGRRPGTENVAAAVGCAKAVEIALLEMEQESARLRALREMLELRIRSMWPGIRINGDPASRLPHLLSISFDSSVWSMEGEMLVIGMDLEGVACSSGSACTSGSVQPSHVLLAVGCDPATAKATIRFSFGKSNSPEDIPEVVDRLGRVLERMARRAGG